MSDEPKARTWTEKDLKDFRGSEAKKVPECPATQFPRHEWVRPTPSSQYMECKKCPARLDMPIKEAV